MTPSSKTMASPPGSLLSAIEREHDAEMCLCNMLEQLADALPEPLDARIAPAGIATLRICVRRHIILEEHCLLPMLLKRAKPGEINEDLLAHITREHASDECHAHEAADEMEKALSCGRVVKPEMLGYMLRCFFESRRRHIAWENAIIIPLARLRLSKKDLAGFSESELAQEQDRDLFAGLSDGMRSGCSRTDEE